MTVLRNGNDTYVAQSQPSLNFAGSVNLVCKAGASQFQSFIYFALPPATYHYGVTILEAKLKLYLVSPETATHTVTVRRITSASWQLSKTNWNNKPTSTTTGQVPVVMSGTSPVGRELVFDVTAMMQLVSDGAVYGGFHIVNDIDDFLYLGSTQHPTYKPVLEITWADNPVAPTTLAPSGNRAVSMAKPVLRFDFTDVSGSTQLQAVQVQINSTNVWTAPSFDSGVVAASVPQLDLATTAYAGLADAASVWWRVRTQDGAGLWSDWSDAAQFQRRAKGTLTVTNPPVSGLITEPTPPILWSFTGTQTAWQIFITTPGSATSVYNTGKVSGTATAHTLPAGILKDDSTYTLNLRVWDNIDREATPGEFTWVHVNRNFTYDYDATIDPVTTLAATDLAPAPGVTLTWSRATAPDSFAIRRDGQIIAANLLPGPLSTGGITYAYVDPTPDPGRPVTWRVDSIVNGKTSSANPTVTKTLDTQGIWLTDGGTIQVQIVGQEQGTWGMGEQSATYTPIGAQKTALVTQALRGYEGTINGQILSTDTGTLQEKFAALMTLKGGAGRVRWLTIEDSMTIPVLIRNVVAAPAPGQEPVMDVSFDFYQFDELPFTAIL
jgi:hypothetical protein